MLIDLTETEILLITSLIGDSIELKTLSDAEVCNFEEIREKLLNRVTTEHEYKKAISEKQ